MTKAIIGLLALSCRWNCRDRQPRPGKMGCGGPDLQKVNAMMPAMADGQNKMAMYKEMAMTQTAMSKENDMKRPARRDLNMAAKAGMAKVTCYTLSDRERQRPVPAASLRSSGARL